MIILIQLPGVAYRVTIRFRKFARGSVGSLADSSSVLVHCLQKQMTIEYPVMLWLDRLWWLLYERNDHAFFVMYLSVSVFLRVFLNTHTTVTTSSKSLWTNYNYKRREIYTHKALSNEKNTHKKSNIELKEIVFSVERQAILSSQKPIRKAKTRQRLSLQQLCNPGVMIACMHRLSTKAVLIRVMNAPAIAVAATPVKSRNLKL